MLPPSSPTITTTVLSAALPAILPAAYTCYDHTTSSPRMPYSKSKGRSTSRKVHVTVHKTGGFESTMKLNLKAVRAQREARQRREQLRATERLARFNSGAHQTAVEAAIEVGNFTDHIADHDLIVPYPASDDTDEGEDMDDDPLEFEAMVDRGRYEVLKWYVGFVYSTPSPLTDTYY
jgi:hypothetical protein